MENGLGAQEESDFKVEWFDPEKHFFANERLNEFGELSSSDIPDEFDWTDYVNPPIKVNQKRIIAFTAAMWKIMNQNFWGR